jgi:CBS domain-containing protein
MADYFYYTRAGGGREVYPRFYATKEGAGYPLANETSPFTVADVMSTDVEWINDNDSCLQAAEKMIKRNVGALPVKYSVTGQLTGIITDRDLVRRVLAFGYDPAGYLVSAAMSWPVFAVYHDANLVHAERLMIQHQVRRLLVQRRSDSVIIGIISVDDIARRASELRAGEVIRGTAPVAVPESRAQPAVTATTSVGAGLELRSDVSFSSYRVSDVMRRNFEWIREHETCQEAADKMARCNIGFLPVCSSGWGGALTGVITDRDLVSRVIEPARNIVTTLVREVMTRDVTCCFTDDNLSTAENLMLSKKVRRLPVLFRGSSRMAGIISVDDIAFVSRQRSGQVISETSLPSTAATLTATGEQA